MENAQRKRIQRLKEKNKNATNQNNPMSFGIATFKDLVKLIIWVLIGANFVFITGNYCLPSESLYDQSWPYSMKKSNFLFSWWGKTLITAWHSSRGILKSVLDYLNVKKEWQKTGLVFSSPILVIMSLFVIPVIGFFTTMYGAFRKGSEDCQHSWLGIFITIAYIFMGILFMLGSVVGILQLIYFLILVTIIPFTQESGLENVVNTFSQHKGKISFIFGVLIIINAFKFLNYKIGIGMIAALVISLLSMLVGSSKNTNTE